MVRGANPGEKKEDSRLLSGQRELGRETGKKRGIFLLRARRNEFCRGRRASIAIVEIFLGGEKNQSEGEAIFRFPERKTERREGRYFWRGFQGSREFCRGRGASIAIVEIFLGRASKEKKPEQGKQHGYGFYQLDPLFSCRFITFSRINEIFIWVIG